MNFKELFSQLKYICTSIENSLMCSKRVIWKVGINIDWMMSNLPYLPSLRLTLNLNTIYVGYLAPIYVDNWCFTYLSTCKQKARWLIFRLLFRFNIIPKCQKDFHSPNLSMPQMEITFLKLVWKLHFFGIFISVDIDKCVLECQW